MNDFVKGLVSKAVAKVNVVEVVDGLQSGLMKTHEFVGHASDVVSDALDTVQIEVGYLAADMQDGIMSVSEKLDEYAGLAEAVQKVSGKFGEPGTPVKDKVKPDANNTQDWNNQTREQKVAAIIKYFGFANTQSTREVYAGYTDDQLDAILRVISKYK